MQHSTCANIAQVQKVTQFDLQNLIRKCQLFSKISLKPGTRLVLESLVYHYPKIRVKTETLMAETGNSRRSVDNALTELKEKNLIVITHTGRSSIFNLTQTFFDLLEIAPQSCRKEHVRHADIALPHNKPVHKIINKPFRDFNFKNETDQVKKLLSKDSILTNKELAEIVLNGYHKFNTKTDKDFKVILQMKEIWNLPAEKFEILRYIQENKKHDEIFRKKMENFESEIKTIFQEIKQ